MFLLHTYMHRWQRHILYMNLVIVFRHGLAAVRN